MPLGGGRIPKNQGGLLELRRFFAHPCFADLYLGGRRGEARGALRQLREFVVQVSQDFFAIDVAHKGQNYSIRRDQPVVMAHQVLAVKTQDLLPFARWGEPVGVAAEKGLIKEAEHLGTGAFVAILYPEESLLSFLFELCLRESRMEKGIKENFQTFFGVLAWKNTGQAERAIPR